LTALLWWSYTHPKEAAMNRTMLTIALLVVGILLMLAAVLQHLDLLALHVQHLALYEGIAALLALAGSIVLVFRTRPGAA
jgi:uncharacterized membrane protein YdcZ (DUF606 family)